MPGMNGRGVVKCARELEELRGFSSDEGVKIIMTATVRDMKEVFASFQVLFSRPSTPVNYWSICRPFVLSHDRRIYCSSFDRLAQSAYSSRDDEDFVVRANVGVPFSLILRMVHW